MQDLQEIKLSQQASEALGLSPIPQQGSEVAEQIPPVVQTIPDAVAPEGTVTPTPPPTPTATTPDFKAIFGEEYDHEDKVKNVLKEYGELKGKLSEYEKKVADTEYDNDYIKSLRSAIKQGRTQESHDKVYYSDPTKMSDAEKVALRMQWEDGIDAEKAIRLVNYQYRLGDDYDAEDRDVEMARLKLEVDAKKADTFINEHRQRESAPVVDDSHQKQVQAWTPEIPSIASSVVEINIPGSEWKHKASPETVKEVEKFLIDLVSNEDVIVDQNNPQSKAELQAIAQKEIWWRERENILKAARTEWEKEAIRQKSVVPPPQGTQVIVATEQSERDKAIARAIREGF